MAKRIKKYTAPSPDTVEIVVDSVVAALTGNASTATAASGLITTAGGGTTLTMGSVTAGQILVRSGTTIVGSSVGAGDVTGPANNTNHYVPIWNGADSKTLENGHPASATAGASTIVISDGSNKVDTWVSAASTSVVGIVELAIASEVTTGTSATLAVTPDALAGSTIFGVRGFNVNAIAATVDVTVADGHAYVGPLPACVNGMNLINPAADTITAGVTNATTIQVHNVTDAVDMLSANISIASTTTHGTGTVDTGHDDVATGDMLRIDVDAISTTAPKGLFVTLEFQLP